MVGAPYIMEVIELLFRQNSMDSDSVESDDDTWVRRLKRSNLVHHK